MGIFQKREEERKRQHRLEEARRRQDMSRYVRRELDEDEDELLECYQRIETLQNRLRHAAAEFDAMIADNPELAQMWREFTKLGGLNAHDLERFLNGKVIRIRTTRTKKHLRLISSRPIKPITIRYDRRGGDDVA